MKGCVVCQFRMANYLTPIVDCTSVVSRDPAASAQVAEVRHRTVVPQQGVIFDEIETTARVERCTGARGAHHLTLIVDKGRDPIRIARVSGKRLNKAILPNDRLKLVDGAAGSGVRHGSL